MERLPFPIPACSPGPGSALPGIHKRRGRGSGEDSRGAFPRRAPPRPQCPRPPPAGAVPAAPSTHRRAEVGPGGGAHIPAGAQARTREEGGGAARGPGWGCRMSPLPAHTSAGGRGANH